MYIAYMHGMYVNGGTLLTFGIRKTPLDASSEGGIFYVSIKSTCRFFSPFVSFWSNRCVPRSTFTYACIAERTTTGVMIMASEEKHVLITLLLMCPPEYRWIMCIRILLSTIANGRRFKPMQGRNFLFKSGSLDIGHRA